MNNIIGILLGIILLGAILYGGSKIEKTDKGFKLKDKTVHTYYQSRIIWGDGYTDHDGNTSVHNTEVMAFGSSTDGEPWIYKTTTDDNGEFIVEVMADRPFNLKASDGNAWSETAEEIIGVAAGTTFDDRT